MANDRQLNGVYPGSIKFAGSEMLANAIPQPSAFILEPECFVHAYTIVSPAKKLKHYLSPARSHAGLINGPYWANGMRLAGRESDTTNAQLQGQRGDNVRTKITLVLSVMLWPPRRGHSIACQKLLR